MYLKNLINILKEKSIKIIIIKNSVKSFDYYNIFCYDVNIDLILN